MKKAIIPIISLAVIGLIGFTLYGNKEEMKAEAKLAEVTSEAIPVEVTSLQKKAIQGQVEADGVLVAKTDLTLLSETQGKIIRVFKEKGSYTQKGELLAKVESDIIESEVEAAKINLEKLQSDLERFTKLAKEDAVTKRQLEEVKIGVKNAESQYRAAKKRLENTEIRATATGKINNDFVQEGEFIGMSDELYEIVDASILKLNVKLTAAEVIQLEEGDSVTVTIQLYPQKEFKAHVRSIASKADGALRYNVEIELPNNQAAKLKPGMYATAHFKFDQSAAKYYLKRDALIGSVQNPEVYVVNKGYSELKSLTLGENRDDVVEVLSGISPQDKVVLNGQINLSEGTKVTVLEK